MKDHKRFVLLEGVVGSTAYGLATPTSDKDRLGVYLARTRDVLGLDGPEAVSASRVSHEPDVTLHELGKYVSLALKANPTVLELMWLDSYTVRTAAGQSLIDHRQHFLSETYVRNAYGGYAKQQADRLLRRNAEGKEGFSSDVKNRTAKHARHCLRLLTQGRWLLQTGGMMIDVSFYRDWLFDMGELAASDPEAFYHIFQSELADFNRAESVLPEKTNREAVNNLVIKTRLEYLV